MAFQKGRNTEQLSQYSEQTTGWATDESGFDLRQGRGFSSVRNVYSCRKAHSNLLYSVGTGNAFIGGKAAGK